MTKLDIAIPPPPKELMQQMGMQGPGQTLEARRIGAGTELVSDPTVIPRGLSPRGICFSSGVPSSSGCPTACTQLCAGTNQSF